MDKEDYVNKNREKFEVEHERLGPTRESPIIGT
jgi:hypothetical protein